MRSWTVALPIALAAALAAPGTAAAATSIELSGGELAVVGDAFANDIEVRRLADGYRVRDPVAALTIETGSPCFFTSSARPPHEAKCLRSSEAALRIEGRAGGDELTVVGGSQTALLDGENGDDRLVGGPGPDNLRGGAGADALSAGNGDDVMRGEGGPDGFEGGPGVDTVTYSERSTGVAITLPVDSFDARADDGNLSDGLVALGRDTIGVDVENAVGGDGEDSIVASNAANVLDSGGGRDVLFGRGGDDLLKGGPQADELTGNDGFDRAFYGERTTPVTVTLDGKANDGDPAVDTAICGNFSCRDNVETDVEGVIGGAANDNLGGDDGPNLLDGRGGDDALEGFEGGDDLIGGPGLDQVSYRLRGSVSVSLDGVPNDGNALDSSSDNVRADIDVVVGSEGDDVLVGSDGADVLSGSLGNDRLEGRGGDDTLDGDFGSDLLDGGEGVDTASYEDFDVPVTVSLDGLANDGSPDGTPIGPEIDNVLTENVTGGRFGDTIIGDDGPNVLSGAGGNDSLQGAGGNDALEGGAGLDGMKGAAGGDVLQANDGLDDAVSCGAGLDIANVDLADGSTAVIGGGILPAAAECELQNIAPAGRLPNVALAKKTVHVDGRRRAHVALRCPRSSHRRCAGSVRLQRLDGTDLGAGRFAIRTGRRTMVTVRLRRPVRRGVARILARERDVDGRPKLTLARVQVRR